MAPSEIRRALVIGSPGAGKSVFARALADRTGLPLYCLDRIYWRPDRTTLSRPLFDAALARILEQERWILDGMYRRTLERRLARCDTVFFLDYPPEVCREGIRQRAGVPRPDMPWIEEQPDEELLALAAEFPRRQRPEILERLEGCTATKIIFHTREQASAWLAALPGPIAEPSA